MLLGRAKNSHIPYLNVWPSEGEKKRLGWGDARRIDQAGFGEMGKLHPQGNHPNSTYMRVSRSFPDMELRVQGPQASEWVAPDRKLLC